MSYNKSAFFIFRRVFGLLSLWWVLPLVLHSDLWFSESALFLVQRHVPIFGLQIGLDLPASMLFIAFFLASLGLILNWIPRLSSFLLFVGMCSIVSVPGYAPRGVDVLFRFIALLFVLYPWPFIADAKWQWLRIAENPAHVLRVQFFILYASNTVAKILGPDWISGQAVAYVSMLRDLNFFSVYDFFTIPTVSALFTYLTIALEGLLAIFVLCKPLRFSFLIIAVSFHLTLGLLFLLNPWHEMMIACWIFIYASDRHDSSNSFLSRALSTAKQHLSRSR